MSIYPDGMIFLSIMEEISKLICSLVEMGCSADPSSPL
uniref:Uncharacterized protein n=1 Tax=Anguilla anguilla TaxID=7936 RepID=A0A0E9XX83_ANGAN